MRSATGAISDMYARCTTDHCAASDQPTAVPPAVAQDVPGGQALRALPANRGAVQRVAWGSAPTPKRVILPVEYGRLLRCR